MRRHILTILLLAVFLIVLSLSVVTTKNRAEFKIGTVVSITLQGYLWTDFNSAFDKAFAAIDRVDKIADIYDKDSEISRLNKYADKGPLAVSDELFSLIEESLEACRESDGSFDITVGPLVKLWRPYKGRDSIPTAQEVSDAKALVGHKGIILNKSKGTIYFKKEGMSVDLSAIAKGYAVDKSIEALRAFKVRSAMVNAGGDLYCLGKKNFILPWRVGVIDPENPDEIIRVLKISDKGVATSGGYEQYFEFKGRDYTHLIHPDTGYPVETIFSSITVVAPNCTIADAIATAVSVGGTAIKKKLEGIYPDIEIIAED